MARRHRAPHAEPARAKSDPETTGTVTHASAASDATDTVQALPVETHDPSVHDALLETVSVTALQSHDDAAPELAPQAMPEPVEAGTAAEPASTADALPIRVAYDGEPGFAPPVASEPAPTVTPMLPAPAPRRTLALEALGELSETNATVVGFLRSEGTATLAHWRSLAGAKSPAEAVRLQVDEMQRAADASLTCLNTLARRAGRFAGLLTRD